MGLELAKAFIAVHAESSSLGRDFASIQNTATSSLKKIAAFAAGGFGAVIGAQTIGGLVGVAQDAVAEAGRAQESYSRLGAVLKATGGAAGFSVDQLAEFASQIQATTTVSDDEVMESMAILGTFKSVAGDTFKRATEAAADLAATGFGSMESASTMLGKALENPTQGLTALRRVGVTFSEGQQKQIKQFMEMNDLASAQKLILEAVEGQVGGVAEALGDTDTGKMKQLENTLGDIKEELGAAIMPLFIKFKELQIIVMQRLVDIVKWIRVMASNSDIVWNLLIVQAQLTVSRIADFFVNLFFALPTYAMAAVKTMNTAFWGFIELTKNSLFRLLEMFKTTFEAIQEFWLNVFTGEGVIDSFNIAMDKIGAGIKKSVTENIKEEIDLAKKIGAKWAEETKDIDLLKMSDRSKRLETERDSLAGRLAEARAEMDQKEASSKTSVAAQVAQAIKETPLSIEAGRTGFAEFGKKIQEAVFKDKNADQKKMITLLEAGNKIQEEILKTNKEKTPIVEAGLI